MQEVDPIVANRYLVSIAVTAALGFFILRLWKLPNRDRRTMLLAYHVVAFFQSSAMVWLNYSRIDPNAKYTKLGEAVAYFAFAMTVLEWPLVFGVVHESLNGYLAPYRGLQSIGQQLFRSGLALAALAALASALIAPADALAALSFLYRFQPIVIYGCAAALCLGVAAFVWHFQLQGSANERTTFIMVLLVNSQFAVLWAGQHFLGAHETMSYWGTARVAMAAPILVFAALKLSLAGETRPVAVAATGHANVRQALEDLNASLERGIRS